MADKFISRGFKGRARETDRAFKERIPPGQYETKDFPVLSAGPTPRTALERWDFSTHGEIAEDLIWNWDEFRKLPRETVTVDIHCVTKWSSTPSGRAFRSTGCSKALTLMRNQPSVISSLIATAGIRPIYRSPTSEAEKRGSLMNTMGSLLRPSTEVRRACSCPISTFGKARNGCAASNS